MDCWGLKTVLMYRIVYSLGKYVWLFLVLVSCGEVADSLPYYNTPDFTPLFVNQRSAVEEMVPHKIAPFSFQDQNGQTITDQSIDQKVHVANFIFTSCVSICPVMTNNMKSVADEFVNDPEFAILSYSVTPWIDTVDKLREYTRDQDIDSDNWHFLTGRQEEIYTLARRSYFAEEDFGFTKDSTEFLHTEHVLLVDKTKRIRGIYNGTLPLDMKQLIEDVKLLKRE